MLNSVLFYIVFSTLKGVVAKSCNLIKDCNDDW